jgi:DNA invertase Pin-like site-specific DNA recombinase
MQIAALKRYGVPENLIFTDLASGGAAIRRPNFIRALKYAKREGTEFVVWKLDRLGRTLTGILDTLKMFEEQGIKFISLTERFETATPMGRAMIHLLAVFSQLERDLIRERTMEGIRRKRERGEVHGRPIVMTPERAEEARRLLAEGVPGPDVLKIMKSMPGPKISRSGFYKWHRENNATYRKAAVVDQSDDLY